MYLVISLFFFHSLLILYIFLWTIFSVINNICTCISPTVRIFFEFLILIIIYSGFEFSLDSLVQHHFSTNVLHLAFSSTDQRVIGMRMSFKISSVSINFRFSSRYSSCPLSPDQAHLHSFLLLEWLLSHSGSSLPTAHNASLSFHQIISALLTFILSSLLYSRCPALSFP